MYKSFSNITDAHIIIPSRFLTLGVKAYMIWSFDDAKDKRFSSLIQVKSHNSSENNSQESQLFKK